MVPHFATYILKSNAKLFEKLPLLFRLMIWHRVAALGELNVHTSLRVTSAEEGSLHGREAEGHTQFVLRLCDLR